METIVEIFNRHHTDKNSYHHNYGRQYDDILRKYRDKNIRYLEIGVRGGASIRAMREVFKNCEAIVGLDIDPVCKQHDNPFNKIFVEIGDATRGDFLEEINKKYGPFDVILDDGSHINRDVINTFTKLFPLLKDDGVYIVEDTNVYNKQGFYDSLYPSHIVYFINYIHMLNISRMDYSHIKDFCADPFKIEKKTDDIFDYSIDKIEFGCSIIAIHKKVRTHWIKQA
jgi:hypothetical protein